MTSWAQLLKTSGGTLARMAEEMAALATKDPAPALPKELPPALFPHADDAEALKLYHGSPHEFDKFDFESNLLKGEGAMAYGPGGYTTGDRPLAVQYANKLSRARVIPARPAEGPLHVGHAVLQESLKTHPDETLAWLAGRNFQKADGLGMTDPNRVMSSKVKSQFAGAPYLPVTKGNDVNIDAYKEWIARKGLTPEDLRQRAMTTASRDDILRVGEKLAGAPSPVLGAGPQEWRKVVPGGTRWAPNVELKQGERFIGYPDRAVIQNLRAVAAAQSDIAGPTYKASMDSSIPLGDKWRRLIEQWDGKMKPPVPSQHVPGTEPKVYELELGHGPNDLLFQDYPLAEQPRLQGALSRLYATTGIKPLPPHALGSQLINALPNNLDGMMALKQAGIPASAFLRGGRRSVLPREFDPSDFNFVIHDQDALDILKRTNKAEGGSV